MSEVEEIVAVSPLESNSNGHRANGRIVQIIGPVVDVEFPEGNLPEINTALEISHNGGTIVLEVANDLGNNWVRSVSMQPTDGLSRGQEVIDTGRPIEVPVGEAVLGRVFNVVGEPTDNLGPVKTDTMLPIHRLPAGPHSAVD